VVFPLFRQRKLEHSTSSYAALLIDMQERFLKRYTVNNLEPIISAQTAVLRFCGSHDIPLVVIEYYGCGSTAFSLREVIADIPRTLTVEKSVPDAFAFTSLDEQLRRWNVTDLLVMGIYASACVQDTSKKALQKGYHLHTARDCIADAFTLCGEGKTSFDWYKEHVNLYKTNKKLLESVASSLG